MYLPRDKPASDQWFTQSPIGHNSLDKLLKTIFNKAGINSDKISNHSLRATSISRMYNQGIPEKLIMEQSGHLSKEGVRSYERTTDVQMKHVSDVLSDISCSSKVNTCNPKVAKPGSTSTTVDTQEWDQLDEFFKSIPEDVTSNPDQKPMPCASMQKPDPSDLLKGFKFGQVQGCTFNFTFQM